MQAIMLAAGMGKRLGKYTNGNTKCMVEVAGKKLIDRAIESVKYAGIKKFIVVIGYKGENLKKYILDNHSNEGIEFVFIDNPRYDSTNNIYSLYLAHEYMEKDDTVLLESDLIYEKDLIKNVVNCESKDVVTVAKYESWMDGTVTVLDENNYIKEFIEKKDFDMICKNTYYKTVNIYKFSKEFSKNQYIPFLKAYITSYGENQYYELVLKAIAHIATAGLKAYCLEDEVWYEIDDAQDLDIANALFSKGEEKLKAYTKRFGGYWRFNNLKDFCYLVNPYFPTPTMIEKMKENYLELLTQYPSGMEIQKLNSGRLFNIDSSQVLVGNGAAEIINVLDEVLEGSVGVCIPTFNEYIRCFRKCRVKTLDTSKYDYQLKKDELIKLANTVDNLVIVNPDNPSGSFLSYEEVMEIIEYCHSKNKRIVIDESFVDFANKDRRYTLIDSSILNKYDNLIVIKSISKSYGVPGLRLGVVTTGNCGLLQRMKDLMAVWNINSFGEYFLQIMPSYQKEYAVACDKIAEERCRFFSELSKIDYLKVYSSEANYILCEVKKNFTSKELTLKLLEESNVLIKDLSSKVTFEEKQYIRIAVRDKKDNDYLINKLRAI